MIAPDRLGGEPLLLSQQELDAEPVEDRPDCISGAAVVPSSQSLKIALPRAPSGRRDLIQLLAAHSPVPPEHLVWTSPITGSAQGAEITIVRREWLNGFVGGLERERGHMLQARTARDQLLFEYVSPASLRARSSTLYLWIASLIVAGMVTFSAPDRSNQRDMQMAINESVVAKDSKFSRTGLTVAITGEPLGKFPTGLITGISGKNDGSLLIELNTQEPDTLRNLISERELLPGYREFGQARSRDGGYRVTYGREGLREAQLAILTTDRVPILRARDAAQAIAVAEQTLTSHATAQSLQLALMAPTANGEAVLEFDIELSGPQKRVLAAINAIESGSPPMRFAKWELTPDRTGIRLVATLTVPWTSAK